MRQFAPGITIPHDLSAAPFFAGVYGGHVVSVAFINAKAEMFCSDLYYSPLPLSPWIVNGKLPGPICTHVQSSCIGDHGW